MKQTRVFRKKNGDHGRTRTTGKRIFTREFDGTNNRFWCIGGGTVASTGPDGAFDDQANCS